MSRRQHCTRLGCPRPGREMRQDKSSTSAQPQKGHVPPGAKASRGASACNEASASRMYASPMPLVPRRVARVRGCGPPSEAVLGEERGPRLGLGGPSRHLGRAYATEEPHMSYMMFGGRGCKWVTHPDVALDIACWHGRCRSINNPHLQAHNLSSRASQLGFARARPWRPPLRPGLVGQILRCAVNARQWATSHRRNRRNRVQWLPWPGAEYNARGI